MPNGKVATEGSLVLLTVVRPEYSTRTVLLQLSSGVTTVPLESFFGDATCC